MAALLRVDGMTGAGKAYAGGNKGTCSDVYRRGIQNDTVIVDDRQAVSMDVKDIVTVVMGEHVPSRVCRMLRRFSCSLGAVRLYSQHSCFARFCSSVGVFS